jgi:7,8-dihydropterin-6-yl-methyl-4-(beta-D-ribofuranosyl)aminobenzene 5'-phosphate synthase
MSRLLKLVVTLLLAGISAFPVLSGDLELTIVCDNNPYREGLETRWGFSCLVEGLERTLLFDVGGDGTVLLSNMAQLGIDPKQIDAVILSHIHGDHIGGLPDFLEQNPDVVVYIPESFPRGVGHEVERAGAQEVKVDMPLEIYLNAYSTGELGSWIKEQALVIQTAKGLVVITGCAYPGVVEIVQKAKQMLSDEVYLVTGGFHLCWMSIHQVRTVVKGMQRQKVEKIAPCHCSGNLARDQFEKYYGKDFIRTGVGTRITIVDAFQRFADRGSRLCHGLGTLSRLHGPHSLALYRSNREELETRPERRRPFLCGQTSILFLAGRAGDRGVSLHKQSFPAL